MWCPAENVQLLVRFRPQTETEIYNFDMFCGNIHKNVVQFEVAMCVAFRVHVGDAPKELLENMLTSVHRQTLVWHLLDVMVNAGALAELHD